MSEITDVAFWYDTGYTDGSTEIPPVGHVLPEPNLFYEGPFNPSKDREFSELKIEADYLTLLNVSYIRMTINLNNSVSPLIVYGWVDDVFLQSDTEEAPITTIKWHVDPWRTWNRDAVYGSGFVNRRPSTEHDYYQNFPYRYKLFNSEQTLIQLGGNNMWWVLISINEKKSDNVSRNTLAFFPVLAKTDSVLLWTDDDHNHRIMCPEDLIECRFDEKMGINPETIMGVWICPYCPFSPQSGHTQPYEIVNSTVKMYITQLCKEYDHPWVITEGGLETHGHSGWYQLESAGAQAGPYTPMFKEYPISITPMTSTETNEIYITGFNGETLGTIPYGMTVTSGTYRLVYGVTNTYIEFRFNDGIHANSEGLVVSTPLPVLNCNENSWSQYLYSGQREYDITQRNLGSISSGITGGITSGSLGAVINGSTRTTAEFTGASLIGKTALTSAGLMSGFVPVMGASLIGAALETAVFNDLYQQSEDKLHANQPDGMLFSGTGIDNMYHGQGIMMVQMKYDDDSMSAINDMRTVQGVKYDMPVSDCTQIISDGGPLQITNLIVKGDIPTMAKKWIKDKFAKGVRIIER